MSGASKSKIIYILLSAYLVAAQVELCLATNYYVEVTGNYTNSGLATNAAWPTIPHAIQNTANGDTVNVGIGYFTSSWINVYKEITIQGSDLYNAGNPPLARHTSRTHVWYQPGPAVQESALLEIQTNNITIRNITFNGNFITNVAAGIFNEWGNLTVEYCSFRNFSHQNGAYALLSWGTNSASGTPDNEYCHFNFNLFENIINTDATGILLKHSPANVSHNEFNTITGGYAQAGILINQCISTNGSPVRTSIDSNYLFNCTQGIWGNDFANLGHEIYIRDNTITNTLVGIRLTSADGPGIITGNFIAVGGVSPTTNATPARGIWVQADSDPWNTAPTDHQIINNIIIDISTNAGTTGVLLEYDTTTFPGINSGVRATVLSNSLSDFDIGLYVEAGTNGINHYHSPLVEVTAQYNDIVGTETWSILAEGMTNSVTATDNWLGTYANPSNVVSGNINISNTVLTGSKFEDYDGDGTNDFADADDDNDLLLDTNETAIGTCAVAPDTDYDGQSDWEEYKVAGTDPLDRNSTFEMTVTTNASDSFTLVWPSSVNRIYTIYRSTNLSVGFGAPYTNQFAGPPSNTFVDVTATNATQYFYKLSVTNTVM